jgi:phage terminase large subunit
MAAKTGFSDGGLSEAELLEMAEAIDLDETMGALERAAAKPKAKSKEPTPTQVWVEPQLPVWAGWLRVSTNLKKEPVRHRVFYGGRGGAKSRSIATELLVRGTRRAERILCAREFQKSIRDSVKRLLDDEINRLGLGLLGTGFYVSTDKEIRGRNGTLFVFHGLHRNEGGIRSLEGITICWVEEARFVTQDSLDALIPTIRQEGSEIWWSYNPKDPDDPVDKMFRGKDGPPPGSVVVEVNYYDNPWFPTTLRRDMEWDQRRDADRHAHIWLGRYLLRSEAKVFKNWKVRPFEIPDDAVLRHGADWGFSIDPTVLVQCFIGSWSGEAWESDAVADPDGKTLFVCREAYEVGCEVDEIPSLFAGEDEASHPTKRRWVNDKNRPGVPGSQRWKIIADSARPEIISYLQKRGFNIEPAVKGPGSVEEGVTFLQSFDICVHPDCIHVADELALYSYKVDKKTDEVLPVLADKDNHTIDALRYACEAARRAGTGKVTVASSGQRVTVAALEGTEAAERKKVERPTVAASAGGKGWGSAGGMREGLM